MRTNLLLNLIPLLTVNSYSQTLDFTPAEPQPNLMEAYGGTFGSADIDLDGDIDLLMTGLTPQSATKLYLNNGSGGFTEVTSHPFTRSGGTKGQAIFKDLDSDGDYDLFFSGRTVLNVFFTNIYRNNGSGVFTQVVNNALPQIARGAAIEDVDNDGDQDIIITATSPGFSGVYLNNGTAIFTPQGSSAFAAISGALEFIDIENDGDKDIIISGNKTIKLYENNGLGNFTPNINSTFAALSGEDIDVADTDNDGDFDFLVNGNGLNLLYINNGSGIFTQIATVFQQTSGGQNAIEDLDNDGDQDVLIVGTQAGGLPNIHNYVYQNMGNNAFIQADRLGGEYIADCVVADFTGDGLKDVIIQGFANNTTVFWNATVIRPQLALDVTAGSAHLSLSKLLLRREYRIMRAPTLSGWQEAHRFTATAATFSWNEAISTQGPMFYRLEWNE
jgi:hypothetical protein